MKRSFMYLMLGSIMIGAAAMAGAATPDLSSCDSWKPACSGNYTASSRPGSYPINYVVIHKVQGTASSAASWFANCSANVSAHFIYNNSSGYCYQSVREKDIAWHAGNWTYNTQSVGIEHGGYVTSNDTAAACYDKSALETRSCIILLEKLASPPRIMLRRPMIRTTATANMATIAAPLNRTSISFPSHAHCSGPHDWSDSIR